MKKISTTIINEQSVQRAWKRYLFLLAVLVLLTIFLPAILGCIVASAYIIKHIAMIISTKTAVDFQLANFSVTSFWFPNSTLALILDGVIITIASLVSALVYSLLVASRIRQGEKVLLEISEKISEQETDFMLEIKKLSSYTEDIAGYLASVLFKIHHSMEKYKNDLAIHITQSARIQSELLLANDLQQSLLPKTIYLDKIEWYAKLIPATEIAGDYYDLIALDSRYTLFSIGDVCGKGIPACLFMFRTVSTLRALSQQLFSEDKNFSTATLLTRMALQLASDNPMRYFVTLLVGILDSETGKIRFANAGHLSPWHLSSQVMNEINPEKCSKPLGLSKNNIYVEQELQLTAGDAFFCYTDGLPESFNDKQEMLTTSLLELFVQGRLNLSCQELLDGTYSSIKRFCQSAKQHDDMTAFIIRWQPKALQATQKSLSSSEASYLFSKQIGTSQADLTNSIKIMRQALLDKGFNENIIENLLICCEEYAINLINYNEKITFIFIKIQLHNNEMMVYIEDDGYYFDITKLFSLPISKIKKQAGFSGGRGIQIIAGLMDQVYYGKQDQNNVLIMHKRLT